MELEESAAATEYENTTQENKVTKATKEQVVNRKTAEFESLDKSIPELIEGKEIASTELAKVEEFYSKFKFRCVAKPETSVEWTSRCTAALDILSIA